MNQLWLNKFRFLLLTFAVCGAVNLLPSPVMDKALGQTRELIEQFSADEESLRFKYRIKTSPTTIQRMIDFYSLWKTRASQINFENLTTDQRIDAILLHNYATKKEGEFQAKLASDKLASSLAPFLKPLYKLLEDHESTRVLDAQKVAALMESSKLEIDRFNRETFNSFSSDNQIVLLNAQAKINELVRALDEYHRFHDRYNPNYNWWVDKPHSEFRAKLTAYANELERAVYGSKDHSQKIVGKPIGKDALEKELKNAFISYSIDELLVVANKELNWCDAEMRKAAKQLGTNSWKDAQDLVKSNFVPPGDQPKFINQLALEAITYLEASNLITIPATAKETWRMRMMSPKQQKLSPYFLGGHTLLVAYPTADMTLEEKMMSMRGNNPHFARATVHHELIPGHHLQHYMMKRNKPYRQIFNTPFWLEGWAVYWEMLLWDLGFAKTPEDKIGMLFWRKHRCARVIFSLNYHSEQMSEQDCIDFLINRVGHEKNNAIAEVRRSIMAGYGPLYQASYMIGALQFRKLHKEIIQTAAMTNREFHDSILRENNIPVELLRAKLLGHEIKKDFRPTWRFADVD